MIGVLTAIIGDLASIFGCLIELKKEVTAITFVALGTSLPDLFASRSAAMNEKYADASIGNVTGSNSVNVFLGLGVSWVIASIYHATKVDIFLHYFFMQTLRVLQDFAENCLLSLIYLHLEFPLKVLGWQPCL